MKTKIKNILAKAYIASLLLFAMIVPATAATYTVTTTADSGQGSLREALTTAAEEGTGSIVNFAIALGDGGYSAQYKRFFITLQTPLPVLPAAGIVIDNQEGQVIVVKGNGTFQILTMSPNSLVTINNLTLQNGYGKSVTDGGPVIGGCMYVTPGSTLNFNGGGMLGCRAAQGGALYIASNAGANISAATYQGNGAVSNGTAYGLGGAVFVSSGGVITLVQSTVYQNLAGSAGGGVFISGGGSAIFTNSTIDSNSAGLDLEPGAGGGIYNQGRVILESCTITANGASGSGSGIYNDGDYSAGTTQNILPTVLMNNTISAINLYTATGQGFDISGPGLGFSGSYNLIGNGGGTHTCCLEADSTNMLDVRTPMLDDLRLNGGLTWTRALLSGSPAIDGGNTGLIMDQRGLRRPVDIPTAPNAPGGNGADIGAYEVQMSVGKPPAVKSKFFHSFADTTDFYSGRSLFEIK